MNERGPRTHNCAGVVNHLTLSLRVSFAIAYVQRKKMYIHYTKT